MATYHVVSSAADAGEDKKRQFKPEISSHSDTDHCKTLDSEMETPEPGDMESHGLLHSHQRQVPDVTVTNHGVKNDFQKSSNVSEPNNKENGVDHTVLTLSKCGKSSAATLSDSSEHSQRGCHGRAGHWLRKNDYLVLILGSLTFLVGCVVLAIGVYMMRTGDGCSTGPPVVTPIVTDAHHYDIITTSQKSSRPQGATTTLVPTDTIKQITKGDGSDTTNTQADELPAAVEPVNMAEGRSAHQSTTYRNGSVAYSASLAVDGSTKSTFASGSCSRTETEAQPFWSVDLGGLKLVKTVKLSIPRDVPAGELHNFEIRIGQEDDLDLNPLCRHYMGTALVFNLRIDCERPMYGRYVSVKMLGDETRTHNRLTLCEVMVFNQ